MTAQFTDEDVAWAVPQPTVIKINPYRGATRADIEFATAHIRNVLKTTRVLVEHTMATLAENVSTTIKYQHQLDLLLDIEGDLVGQLERAAEAVS